MIPGVSALVTYRNKYSMPLSNTPPFHLPQTQLTSRARFCSCRADEIIALTSAAEGRSKATARRAYCFQNCFQSFALAPISHIVFSVITAQRRTHVRAQVFTYLCEAIEHGGRQGSFFTLESSWLLVPGNAAWIGPLTAILNSADRPMAVERVVAGSSVP